MDRHLFQSCTPVSYTHLVAGGVSANNGLRNAFQEHAEKYGWNIFIPKFSYTTDNAAMIAITGYTCNDLFLQELLLEKAKEALLTIAEEMCIRDRE